MTRNQKWKRSAKDLSRRLFAVLMVVALILGMSDISGFQTTAYASEIDASSTHVQSETNVNTTVQQSNDIHNNGSLDLTSASASKKCTCGIENLGIYGHKSDCVYYKEAVCDCSSDSNNPVDHDFTCPIRLEYEALHQNDAIVSDEKTTETVDSDIDNTTEAIEEKELTVGSSVWVNSANDISAKTAVKAEPTTSAPTASDDTTAADSNTASVIATSGNTETTGSVFDSSVIDSQSAASIAQAADGEAEAYSDTVSFKVSSELMTNPKNVEEWLVSVMPASTYADGDISEKEISDYIKANPDKFTDCSLPKSVTSPKGLDLLFTSIGGQNCKVVFWGDVDNFADIKEELTGNNYIRGKSIAFYGTSMWSIDLALDVAGVDYMPTNIQEPNPKVTKAYTFIDAIPQTIYLPVPILVNNNLSIVKDNQDAVNQGTFTNMIASGNDSATVTRAENVITVNNLTAATEVSSNYNTRVWTKLGANGNGLGSSNQIAWYFKTPINVKYSVSVEPINTGAVNGTPVLTGLDTANTPVAAYDTADEFGRAINNTAANINRGTNDSGDVRKAGQSTAAITGGIRTTGFGDLGTAFSVNPNADTANGYSLDYYNVEIYNSVTGVLETTKEHLSQSDLNDILAKGIQGKTKIYVAYTQKKMPVTKVWDDGLAENMPATADNSRQAVKVVLQQSSDGGKTWNNYEVHTLDGTVDDVETTPWYTEFTGYPSVCPDNSNVVFTYRIVEDGKVTGYSDPVITTEVKDSITYTTITNKLETGVLKIKKTQNGGEQGTVFTFTLKYGKDACNLALHNFTYTVTGTNAPTEVQNAVDGVITLQGNWKATVTGIPNGWAYEVKETPSEGWISTATNDTGTIGKEKAAEVEFVNQKASFGLTITNKVESTESKLADFKYEVQVGGKVYSNQEYKLYQLNDKNEYVEVTGTHKTDKNGTLVINNGQKVEFINITENTAIKVTETQTNGYTTTVNNVTGTVFTGDMKKEGLLVTYVNKITPQLMIDNTTKNPGDARLTNAGGAVWIPGDKVTVTNYDVRDYESDVLSVAYKSEKNWTYGDTFTVVIKNKDGEELKSFVIPTPTQTGSITLPSGLETYYKGLTAEIAQDGTITLTFVPNDDGIRPAKTDVNVNFKATVAVENTTANNAGGKVQVKDGTPSNISDGVKAQDGHDRYTQTVVIGSADITDGYIVDTDNIEIGLPGTVNGNVGSNASAIKLSSLPEKANSKGEFYNPKTGEFQVVITDTIAGSETSVTLTGKVEITTSAVTQVNITLTGKDGNESIATSVDFGIPFKTETPSVTYKLTSPTDTLISSNGGTILYNIQAANNIKTTVKNVVIRDMIPDGTIFDNASNDGKVENINGKQYVIWVIDKIEPGSSVTVNFSVKVPQLTTTETKTFTNVACGQVFEDATVNINAQTGWTDTETVKHTQTNKKLTGNESTTAAPTTTAAETTTTAAPTTTAATTTTAAPTTTAATTTTAAPTTTAAAETTTQESTQDLEKDKPYLAIYNTTPQYKGGLVTIGKLTSNDRVIYQPNAVQTSWKPNDGWTHGSTFTISRLETADTPASDAKVSEISIKNSDGTLKSVTEINNLLKKVGYTEATITISDDQTITLNIPEAKTGTSKTTIKVNFTQNNVNPVSDIPSLAIDNVTANNEGGTVTIGNKASTDIVNYVDNATQASWKPANGWKHNSTITISYLEKAQGSTPLDVKITIRNNDGTMKSESEINKLLADNGYKNSKITIAKDGKITLDIPEAKTGTRKTTVKVSFVKLDSNAVPSSTVSTTEGSTTETTKAGSTTETTKAGSTTETTKAGSTTETTKAGSTTETTKAGSTTETTKAKNTTETTKPESTTSADNNVVSTDITYTLTSTTPTIIPENGGKIVYNITVTNNGTADAKNIVIRDMIPDGTTFASADNNGAIIVINGKQYITWTLDTLKASDSKIVSFTVKVPQMTTSGTKTFINIAEAQSFGDKNIDISITDGWEKTGEIKHIQNNIITPNTGDNMIIIPFIIIAFVSLAVIFLAFADLKRKQKLS